MTTLLDKTLKREVRIQGDSYIVSLTPLTLKLTPKGKRKGLELAWDALVNGDAALATALNASLATLTPEATLTPARAPRPETRLASETSPATPPRKAGHRKSRA